MDCKELKEFISQHPEMSDREVGEQCGYSKSAVQWHRQQLGIWRTKAQGIDETGNRYGRLTVLYKDSTNTRQDGTYWVCQCDCGNLTTVKGTNLRNKQKPVRSCGCDSASKPVYWNNGTWKRIDNNHIQCCKCGHIKPKGNRTRTYLEPCFECSKDEWVTYHAHPCKECGSLVQTPHASLCPACKKKHNKEENRKKSIYSNKNRHRNARKNGKMDYGITFAKLIKRDGNICALCGKPVDINDFHLSKTGRIVPNANYPSVDHIIPLAKGGTHTWDNVQLAHFLCNSLKSDNV